MRKVVFKSNERTGRARVGDPYPNIDGKVGGKVFAQIVRPPRSNDPKPWSVGVRVVSEAGWRWMTFKVRFATAEEAKSWLRENVDAIFAKFQIVSED